MCLPFRIDDRDLRNDMHLFHRTAACLVVLLAVAACAPPNSTSPDTSGVPSGVDASRSQEASTPSPDPVDSATCTPLFWGGTRAGTSSTRSASSSPGGDRSAG
jgi:hypothetical protein